MAKNDKSSSVRLQAALNENEYLERRVKLLEDLIKEYLASLEDQLIARKRMRDAVAGR